MCSPVCVPLFLAVSAHFTVIPVLIAVSVHFSVIPVLFAVSAHVTVILSRAVRCVCCRPVCLAVFFPLRANCTVVLCSLPCLYILLSFFVPCPVCTFYFHPVFLAVCILGLFAILCCSLCLHTLLSSCAVRCVLQVCLHRCIPFTVCTCYCRSMFCKLYCDSIPRCSLCLHTLL